MLVNRVTIKKAVYGLKQSSSAWYQQVNETLCDLGHCKSKVKPCIDIKHYDNGTKTITGIYIDDSKTLFVKNVLSSKYIKFG